MKGLTQFIVDLRNSKDAEEETKRINLELNNIRSKFGGSSLNSYQKKKYVCKLIYIYLLGYTEEVHFGIKQAFELVASTDYSEKQLGYVSISVLYSRASGSLMDFLHHLLDLTWPFLVSDLRSDNPDFNCLALHFIASNFNLIQPPSQAVGSVTTDNLLSSESTQAPTQWQELIELVFQLCVSPVSYPVTKKKAVLAMLVLLKVYPLVILANDNWIPRLLSLVDDPDTSVVLCTIPLTNFIINLAPKYARSLIHSVASRLHALLLGQLCPDEYYYYDVPAPWLIVKLFQTAENFFLLGENSKDPLISTANLSALTVTNLRQAVSKSIQNASKPVKGHPSRNSQSSILFQAVSLAVFLDASPEAIEGAIHALVQLLSSSETNNRYLVLDTLIKLAARSKFTDPFKDYLEQLYLSLNDRDISVRRKTVDLLFTVCDETTYTHIISKLLEFFNVADSSLKSDISVKVAVLAERFASDPIWYVTTMLKLLSIGGKTARAGTGSVDHDNLSSGEVWERIVQIIVNNEELQRKSCKYIMNLLRNPPNGVVAESLMKVAAFVLSDYGHIAAETEESNKAVSIDAQFQILYGCYFRASLLTRPMLLSAFVKIVLRNPQEDFVPDILDLLEAETLSLDLEVQTRATEYLKISSLVTSGNPADIDFARKVVKSLPPFEVQKSSLMKHLGALGALDKGRSLSMVNISKIPRPRGKSVGQEPPIEEGDTMNDSLMDPFDEHKTSAVVLSPNWYSGFHRMLHYDAGIFYEDQLVKLTYRTVKDKHTIQYHFTIINNAAKTAEADITAFNVLEINNMSGGASYATQLTEVPDSTIVTKTNMTLETRIRDVVENEQSPIILLSYKCSGSFNSLQLKVPIVMLKTLTGTQLSMEDFERRWTQIGEFLGSQSGECREVIITNHKLSGTSIVRMLERIGFALIYSTPDVSEGGALSVMGAGILHTLKSNFGVLVTMKSLEAEGRHFDLAVRCTGGGVPAIICDTLKEVLESKV